MGQRGRLDPLLPGMPDLLLLKAPICGKTYSYGIAHRLKLTCEDVLSAGERLFYPALQRLLLNSSRTAGWERLKTIAAPTTTTLTIPPSAPHRVKEIP
jgi:hypothetical protein